MWVQANPNPLKKEVPDCVIRAISIALNQPWVQTFDELYSVARAEFNMPSADTVWGKYLYMKGFEPFVLPYTCPKCLTIKQFANEFPEGIYIIGTGSHAVAVIQGNYYDSWDSGSEIVTFFWRITY